jgi:hypothetical protein
MAVQKAADQASFERTGRLFEMRDDTEQGREITDRASDILVHHLIRWNLDGQHRRRRLTEALDNIASMSNHPD